MGHELAVLLRQHVVGHKKIVGQALLRSDLGRAYVLKRAHRERKCREPLVYFRVERPRALQLQVVDLLEFALVNSAADVGLLGLAFTGRDVDIETDHIAWGEPAMLFLRLEVRVGKLLVLPVAFFPD